MRIICVLIIILTFASAYGEWERVAEIKSARDFEIWENDPSTIFVSQSNAIWYTTDKGQNWFEMSRPIQEYYTGITTDLFNHNNIIVQTPWNVFVSRDLGVTWSPKIVRPFSADSTIIEFSPWRQNEVYTMARTGFYVSNDSGNSWKLLLAGRTRAWAQSAQNPEVIIIHPAGKSIKKSTDGGSTWQSTGFDPNLAASQALFIDPENADVMYAMSYPDVFKSTDGGETWQSRGQWGDLPEVTDVYTIDFYQHDPDIIVLCTNKGVYQTDDAGQTWTLLETEYQNPFYRKAKIIKQDNEPVIYMINYYGIFKYKKNKALIMYSTDNIYFNNTSNEPITKELQVINTGYKDLVVHSIQIDNPAFHTETTSVTILPQDTINIPVTYTPDMSGGTITGVMEIISNAGNGPQIYINLTAVNYSQNENIFQVTNNPAEDVNPFLLNDKQGNLYVFWESMRGGNRGIYWKTCQGGEWSATRTVISDSLHHFSPEAAIDSEGNIWLCYITKDPEYTPKTSSVTVIMFDGDSWLLEQIFKSENYGFHDCDIAVDAFDNIHVTACQYQGYGSPTVYMKKNGNQWNLVDYPINVVYQQVLYLLVPSTTSLPWLIWNYIDDSRTITSTIKADYLMENGEWNTIVFKRLEPDITVEYSDDVFLYSATVDSLGNIYTLLYSNWKGGQTYFVRQFDCMNGEETNNWVLDAIPQITDRYSNFSLCSNRSSVGYTVYDNTEEQMYARLFDGVKWSELQACYGIGESLNLNSAYSTILVDNTIIICTSQIINDSSELYLYNIDINENVDDSIISIDEFVENTINHVDNPGSASIPENCSMNQNYPNPFNPTTTITYTLLKPDHVNISIYNMLGQKVKTLVNGYQTDLNSSVKWHGQNDRGQPVSSGVYFARMQAGENTKTIKMLFLE